MGQAGSLCVAHDRRTRDPRDDHPPGVAAVLDPLLPEGPRVQVRAAPPPTKHSSLGRTGINSSGQDVPVLIHGLGLGGAGHDLIHAPGRDEVARIEKSQVVELPVESPHVVA